jgi:hypothetical protein
MYRMATVLGKRKTMKTSDLFVAALENEGVEYIFALPGEQHIFMRSLSLTRDKAVPAKGWHVRCYSPSVKRPS